MLFWARSSTSGASGVNWRLNWSFSSQSRKETLLPHSRWVLGLFSIQISWFVWVLLGTPRVGLRLSRQLELLSARCSDWVENGEVETGAASWAEHAQRNLVLCRGRQQDLEPSWKETFCLSPPKYLRLQRHGDGETGRQIFLDEEPDELSREEAFRREL